MTASVVAQVMWCFLQKEEWRVLGVDVHGRCPGGVGAALEHFGSRCREGRSSPHDDIPLRGSWLQMPSGSSRDAGMEPDTPTLLTRSCAARMSHQLP